jgi:hypothetical protein
MLDDEGYGVYPLIAIQLMRHGGSKFPLPWRFIEIANVFCFIHLAACRGRRHPK